MIKLYRFIYYMGSYFIRKYDHLWKIGHYYYIWSGCICGAILYLSVWVIFNVLFLLGLSPIVFMNYYYSGLLSIIFDIIICLYLRKNKRYKRIQIKRNPSQDFYLWKKWTARTNSENNDWYIEKVPAYSVIDA